MKLFRLLFIFCLLIILATCSFFDFAPENRINPLDPLTDLPIIESFIAAYSIILLQGSQRDSTALSVTASDIDGSIAAYSYEIVSGGGELSGEDTAAGKIYSSASTAGLVQLKVIVTDDEGDASEQTLDISVLENGHQKISDTEGGFTGILDDYNRFGSSAANIGDLDGDGITDLAVGAHYNDDGGTDRGAVWILFLNSNGTVKSHQKISNTEGGFTGTLDDSDFFGFSVANIGDLNGDGITDIAVGANGDDDGGTDRGAVWILFLNFDGNVKSHQKISDTDGGFTGTLDDSDFFGYSSTNIGDLNGEGIRDLAVGAFKDDDGGDGRGALWILFLNSDGTVKSHQKISDTEGNFTGTLDNGDWFGHSAANIGDLDGDEITDLAVGAYRDDDGGSNRGALWILFLNSNGTVKSHQKISDTDGGFTGTLDNDDVFGVSAAAMGDLDGDEITDLAVGAFKDDDGGDGSGAVWILFINSNGTVKSHQKISNTEGNFTGTLDTSDYFGFSAAAIGDLDGDGITDLAVGAYLDNDGGTDRGAVWILFLNPDGTVLH